MDKELHRTFNQEVHHYRHILTTCAKRCDWESFKLHAGKLFDYVEAVEMSEIERKFLRISRVIMLILFVIAIAFFKVDPDFFPEFVRVKQFFTFSAVGGCLFEFYFFINFRMYMKNKTAFYKQRKERFIRNIERDFRDIILPNLAQ